MKAGGLKILDYFFVLRPTLFYPVWTIALAGHWAQARSLQSLSSGQADPAHFFLFLFSLTLVLGASFLINQITDIVSDKINNKLYLIANGDISIRSAYIETVLLSVIPVLVVGMVRKDLAFLLIIVFLITGWAYSARPFLLKDRPIGGMAANLLGALAIFAYGWCIDGSCRSTMVAHSMPYLLAILAVYFYTTIPDRAGDQAAHKTTVAVKWGVDNTILAGVWTDMGAIVASVFVRDWIILTASLLALPFFIRACRKKNNESVLQTNKFAILFLSLLICVRFPIYLALVVALYFFSKWYYWHRFHITYPSLRT
jgi:1,4-dihydroxy-2-naphthoate octaprenyltransferase